MQNLSSAAASGEPEPARTRDNAAWFASLSHVMRKYLVDQHEATVSLNNTHRGHFSESRVAMLTNGKTTGGGDAWGPVDVKTGDGIGVQIKTSGAYNAWRPEGNAKVSWKLAVDSVTDYTTADSWDDVQVIVLACHRSPDIDTGWEYAAIPISLVRNTLIDGKVQKSWSLSTVRRSGIEWVSGEQLNAAINAAVVTQPVTHSTSTASGREETPGL